MDGNGAVYLAAAAEKAPERKLDFSGIAVCLGHTRENLSCVIEAIVDEVIEADVVIARQADSARGTHAATEEPSRNAYQDERQGEQKWGQLKHGVNDIRPPPYGGRT